MFKCQFNWSAHSFPQVAEAANLATLLHTVAQTQKVRKKLNLDIKKLEQIKLGIMPEWHIIFYGKYTSFLIIRYKKASNCQRYWNTCKKNKMNWSESNNCTIKGILP